MEITRNERDELLFGVFVTAVEQGMGYWATGKQYIWDVPDNSYSCWVKDREDEDAEWLILDRDAILRGIDLVNEKWAHVPSGYQMNAYRGLKSGASDVDYDAETADVVSQFGLLGDLIYG